MISPGWRALAPQASRHWTAAWRSKSFVVWCSPLCWTRAASLSCLMQKAICHSSPFDFISKMSFIWKCGPLPFIVPVQQLQCIVSVNMRLSYEAWPCRIFLPHHCFWPMSRKLAKELVVARQHLLLLVNDVVLRESNLPVTSCPLSLRVIPAADVCLQNGLHYQISSRRTKRSVLCSLAFCFSPCPVLFALRPLPSRLPNMLARSTTLCSRGPTVMLQDCCAPPSAFCSRSRRCLCFYATCFRLLPLAAPRYNLIFLVRAGCVADHAHMFFFSVDVRLAVAEKLSTMLLRGKLRGVWHFLLLLLTARMQLVAQPASS